MSRLGKRPIEIPSGVEVKIDGSKFFVKGSKGELERVFANVIAIEMEGNSIKTSPKNDDSQTLALWGTTASHIMNMMEGVTNGFSKVLLVEGVGFKVQLEGDGLILHLGFSHPIRMTVPKNIKIEVEKNKITVSGVDKELVGQTSAKIRAYKKPEPYKGKGIRYEGEVTRRKAGKKAVGSM